MNTVSLSWLPLAWWWPVSVLLSAALSTAAAAWFVYKQKQAKTHTHKAQEALIFAAFVLLWWAFGFAWALWPLRGADAFAQWAHASSYVLVPLWIGGIAWAAALLAVRLLRTAGR